MQEATFMSHEKGVGKIGEKKEVKNKPCRSGFQPRICSCIEIVFLPLIRRKDIPVAESFRIPFMEV
jgi:hypothetical protein